MDNFTGYFMGIYNVPEADTYTLHVYQALL